MVIEDNLYSYQWETKLALAVWPEIQLQLLPKYAPWFNLIEPWWKQIRSLALKGRRFETATELEEAPWAALVYWSERCHPTFGRNVRRSRRF